MNAHSRGETPLATLTKQHKQSARTREKVLEVASQLMAGRGYSGTSISAISKASGILPASIYWHFESKEGLLASVVERASEKWFDHLTADMSEIDPAEEPARIPFISLRRTARDKPEFIHLLLLLALERRQVDSQTTLALRTVRDRVLDFLRNALEPFLPLQDAGERRAIANRVSELMLALIDGFFIARQIAPEETDFEPLLDLVETSVRATARELVQEAVTRGAALAPTHATRVAMEGVISSKLGVRR